MYVNVILSIIKWTYFFNCSELLTSHLRKDHFILRLCKSICLMVKVIIEVNKSKWNTKDVNLTAGENVPSHGCVALHFRYSNQWYRLGLQRSYWLTRNSKLFHVPMCHHCTCEANQAFLVTQRLILTLLLIITGFGFYVYLLLHPQRWVKVYSRVFYQLRYADSQPFIWQHPRIRRF